MVCQQLEYFGLTLAHQRNEAVIDCEGRISTNDSSLQAYVIPTQEAIASTDSEKISPIAFKLK